ncbi:MAG TPA: hypothetical protein P5186_20550 [Candidatus Paceibacterota bacterium]|nr:hypothetical protein [Verrucomicrobiota bacterium]HRY50450.1 hypothetical protein [Candidatus Paceibacterota bacterium]HRZ99756.1 hypothetical protein [Candidatus Paceibacterota bacterium]
MIKYTEQRELVLPLPPRQSSPEDIRRIFADISAVEAVDRLLNTLPHVVMILNT